MAKALSVCMDSISPSEIERTRRRTSNAITLVHTCQDLTIRNQGSFINALSSPSPQPQTHTPLTKCLATPSDNFVNKSIIPFTEQLPGQLQQNYCYLTINHRRRREYRRIVTETKSRWLSRYSQSLRWLIVLVKLHWWLFEKIKQKLLNLRLRNINKSGRHFEHWKPSLL